jgi:nitrogen fixation/metabolism regulation signal transduction histidine kinase
MAGEVEDDHESRGVNTSMSYLQRTLQATLTIWLSLAVVIIAVFGLSESLRVAGVDRDENVLITFLVALGLILLALWLVPRSFLTLKEERQNGARQRYIQHVLHALSVIWATLAAIMLAAIGLYTLLRVAGVERDENLLITFIVALGLILFALWLLPRSLLTQ